MDSIEKIYLHNRDFWRLLKAQEIEYYVTSTALCKRFLEWQENSFGFGGNHRSIPESDKRSGALPELLEDMFRLRVIKVLSIWKHKLHINRLQHLNETYSRDVWFDRLQITHGIFDLLLDTGVHERFHVKIRRPRATHDLGVAWKIISHYRVSWILLN